MRARIERGTSEPIKITKQVAKRGPREGRVKAKRGQRAGRGGAAKVSTLGPKMVTLKPGATTRTGSARGEKEEGADIIASLNRDGEREG